MYGDIGHGLFLFCSSSFLLYEEKEHKSQKLCELVEGMHAGRYMIVMMGFFLSSPSTLVSSSMTTSRLE
jgi:V-type H+-transporting ATPase subunit a